MQPLGSGHLEARIVEVAQSTEGHGVNRVTASTIVRLLRNCSVYQFHDTSDSSDLKTKWDVSESNQLRSNGGNLAAVLHRLEQRDVRRYELICQQIGRVLPGFDRFDIEEDYGKVLLRWRAKWTRKNYRSAPDLGRVAALFRFGDIVELAPGNVAWRHSVGRAGTRVAPGGGRFDRRHDRGALQTKAGHRGNPISPVGRHF